MRFILVAKGDPTMAPPSPELMAAVGGLTEEMISAGVFLDGGGLGQDWRPEGMGDGVVRLQLAGGRVTVTDGPFTEAKELVGGYAIVDVASTEEAIALGRRFLNLHKDVLGESFEMDSEIREFHGQVKPNPQGTPS